jgi:hypothetical protein
MLQFSPALNNLILVSAPRVHASRQRHSRFHTAETPWPKETGFSLHVPLLRKWSGMG